jgi:hypothetical protein
VSSLCDKEHPKASFSWWLYKRGCVARSASLALDESSSFSWWLTTSRQPRQRACAIERASVELSDQLI